MGLSMLLCVAYTSTRLLLAPPLPLPSSLPPFLPSPVPSPLCFFGLISTILADAMPLSLALYFRQLLFVGCYIVFSVFLHLIRLRVAVWYIAHFNDVCAEMPGVSGFRHQQHGFGAPKKNNELAYSYPLVFFLHVCAMIQPTQTARPFCRYPPFYSNVEPPVNLPNLPNLQSCNPAREGHLLLLSYPSPFHFPFLSFHPNPTIALSHTLFLTLHCAGYKVEPC